MRDWDGESMGWAGPTLQMPQRHRLMSPAQPWVGCMDHVLLGGRGAARALPRCTGSNPAQIPRQPRAGGCPLPASLPVPSPWPGASCLFLLLSPRTSPAPSLLDWNRSSQACFLWHPRAPIPNTCLLISRWMGPQHPCPHGTCRGRVLWGGCHCPRGMVGA